MIAVMFTAMTGLVKPDPSQSFDPLGKLGTWQGRWKYSGQIFETPYSHARSDSGTFDCNWMRSSGYMVCEYDSADPPHNDLSIFSYDSVANAYRHVEVTKDSKPAWSSVSQSGNAWTTATDLPYKNKTLMYQVAFTFIAADKQATTVRISADKGRSWTKLAQTTAVKITP